jgi:hypothetical protein
MQHDLTLLMKTYILYITYMKWTVFPSCRFFYDEMNSWLVRETATTPHGMLILDNLDSLSPFSTPDSTHPAQHRRGVAHK